MSPFEHCAQVAEGHNPKYLSNFDSNGIWSGWIQYRKTLPNENRTNVDLGAIMQTKPDWITI